MAVNFEKTPAELVEMYIRLRDAKDAEKAAYNSRVERIEAGMEKLEGMLLTKLQDLGVDSLTAKGVGTVYRNTKDSATVQDRVAFKDWLDSTGNWDAADIKANKTAVREYMKSGEEVPGVKFSSLFTVGVRRA